LSFQKSVCVIRSARSAASEWVAYLVTVAPEEVLGTDVLVRILGLVFRRRCMLQVLLVGIPSHLSVDTGEDEARDGDTANILVRMGADGRLLPGRRQRARGGCRTRWRA
jgi:hypothetical protein